MEVSFCTVCNNDLLLLKQTLPINLVRLKTGMQIVILDYHSDDGLIEYIEANYLPYLLNKTLVYYSLTTPRAVFEPAYAKNVVHLLASGKILFNLDPSNFIGDDIDPVVTIRDNTIYTPSIYPNAFRSINGRIGMTKRTFIALNGYDESLGTLPFECSDLIFRARRKFYRITISDKIATALKTPVNTYTKGLTYESKNLFGLATVIDKDGLYIQTGSSINK